MTAGCVDAEAIQIPVPDGVKLHLGGDSEIKRDMVAFLNSGSWTLIHFPK